MRSDSWMTVHNTRPWKTHSHNWEGIITSFFLTSIRKNQQRLVDKEDKLALKDRHWKKKEQAEMTDRDWRIFKEDYNIAAKGWFCFNRSKNLIWVLLCKKMEITQFSFYLFLTFMYSVSNTIKLWLSARMLNQFLNL